MVETGIWVDRFGEDLTVSNSQVSCEWWVSVVRKLLCIQRLCTLGDTARLCTMGDIQIKIKFHLLLGLFFKDERFHLLLGLFLVKVEIKFGFRNQKLEPLRDFSGLLEKFRRTTDPVGGISTDYLHGTHSGPDKNLLRTSSILTFGDWILITHYCFNFINLSVSFGLDK